MCAVGGAIYAQYQMYIGPDTIAGLGVSLNIVFAVIAGGMWVMLGPTVGAVFTQVLSEVLRVSIQSSAGLQKIFGCGRACARHDDLRPAADPVHHLHAEGHSRHAPGVAGEEIFAATCARHEGRGYRVSVLNALATMRQPSLVLSSVR